MTLTRPSAQYLALLIAIWLLFSVGWRRAAGYVAVAALVVSPWVVRNWVQLHSPLLVTSNGFNMAAMYSPPAQRIGAFIDPLQDPYFTFMRFDQFDEVAWDKHLERIGEDNLAHHPTLLAKVTARNAAALFELKPSFNRNAEARDGRDLTARDATLWLFYATTIVGIAGLWLGRRRTMTPLLILVAAYFTLASLVFVAPPRLRAPVDLVLAVGVGLFLDEVARRGRSGAGRVDSATIAGRDRPPLAAAVGG